jgi:hypothetical protein
MMVVHYRGEHLVIPAIPVSVTSRSSLDSLTPVGLATAHRDRSASLGSPPERIGEDTASVRAILDSMDPLSGEGFPDQD